MSQLRMKRIDKTIVVGSLMFSPYNKMFEQARRVYSLNGLAPSICAHSGGHLEPKIIRVYEETT